MDAVRIAQFAGFLLAVVRLTMIVRRMVMKARKKGGDTYGVASINAETDDPATSPSRPDRPPTVGSGSSSR